MGYPLELFINEGDDVDKEFICDICFGVLKDPRMLQPCDHIFCSECIHKFMESSRTCPIGRGFIAHHRAPIRSFMNMYHRLAMKCKYEGCTQLTTIEGFEGHVANCQHDPELIKPCANNCGALMKVKDTPAHNCLQYLKEQGETKDAKILDLDVKLERNGSEIKELRKRVGELKKVNEKCKKAHLKEIRSKNNEIKALKKQLSCIPKVVELKYGEEFGPS